MAQPGPAIIGHFWSPDTNAYDAILTLKDAGSDFEDEDVVWAPWAAICRKYFPEDAAFQGGPKYAIHREAYRGMPPALRSQHKPDVVVVELRTPLPGPDGFLRTTKRDILWVECKAPKHDYPAMWKEVMYDATRRLHSAHPDRNVWLILAIGLKWMLFYWDPINSVTNPFPMAILMDDTTGGWTVDPAIRPPPLPPAINQQRYIDHSTGIIHSRRAHSLAFWDLVPTGPNGTLEPRNLDTCLLFLENIIGAVQGHAYQSANPARMRT